MIYGVTFGEKHSIRDFGLYLPEKPIISTPQVQTRLISVPGSDFQLDLTEALDGQVHYEARQISFSFDAMYPRLEWPQRLAEIMRYLHGKRHRIVFDDDPDYFYEGRVTVGTPSFDSKLQHIPVTATVAPYKWEVVAGSSEWLWYPYPRQYANISVTETTDIDIIDLVVPVRPTVQVTLEQGESMLLDYDGKTYVLQDGATDLQEIIPPGSATFAFTGQGTVSVTFRGGML